MKRTDTDDGWINRKFARLERMIRESNAAKRLESATISRGGLTIKGGGGITLSGGGDVHVDDGGEITVDGGDIVVRVPGDLLLQDSDGSTVWQASTAPLVTAHAFKEADGLSIPLGWTVMGHDRVAVPAGYVGTGHFIVMASCGDTMVASDGIVSVQPLFRFVYRDGTQSDWFGGPSIASPESRIAVATSMWASNFATGVDVASVDMGVACARSSGTEDPGNGNFHIAASLIFKRG